MERLKTIGKIHSLDGKEDEITVLEKIGDNSYIVDYRGTKCRAIFNIFACRYYVDDIFGRIENEWQLSGSRNI
jgi:hypothetical protein